MGTFIGIGIGLGMNRSSSRNWTTLIFILESITGGVRLAWTAQNNFVEVWVSINSGTLRLVNTVGIGVGTYDYICDSGATFDFELRSKKDDSLSVAPSGLTLLSVPTGLQLSWTVNSAHILSIERSTIDETNYSVIHTTGSDLNKWISTTVAVSTKYYYRIRSYNGTAYSDYCTSANFTTFGAAYKTIYDVAFDKPGATDAINLNAMVQTIVTAGLWTELDKFIFFASPFRSQSYLDWKNPGVKDAIPVLHGTLEPTYTANEGVIGDIHNYIRTQYVLGTDNVKFTKDSCSIGMGIFNNLINNVLYACGVTDGTNYTGLLPRNGDKAFGILNQATFGLTPANTVTKKHFVVSRTANNAVMILLNKVKTTSTDVSTAIPAGEMLILCDNVSGTPSNFTIFEGMYWWCGSGLSESNCNIITDAINTYLTIKGKGLY